jgi:excisionase family DNA binding protein
MSERDSTRLTVTVPEAAKTLGIGLNNTYGLVSSGRLRAVRVGRKVLVPRRELALFSKGKQHKRPMPNLSKLLRQRDNINLTCVMEVRNVAQTDIPRATLTVRQAAQALGFGVNNTYNLVITKRLRAVKLGRKTVIPKTEIEAFLLRETTQGETE